MSRFFIYLLNWIKKILRFLRIIKSTPDNDSNDNADTNTDSFNDSNESLPVTKDELRKLEAKHVKVERMNTPEEEILKENEYRIVGFAKTIGKWTQKILDERKDEISFNNINENNDGKKIFGKWTAYVFSRQSRQEDKSWKESINNTQNNRSNNSKNDRGR